MRLLRQSRKFLLHFGGLAQHTAYKFLMTKNLHVSGRVILFLVR